tara:strand:+ start:403 stop:603 length:201 start_codon:yes stop_codon:yes gene_type:complete
VVRELGSERRETVRSLSAMSVEELRGFVPSTRGPGWTYYWWTNCGASRSVRQLSWLDLCAEKDFNI